MEKQTKRRLLEATTVGLTLVRLLSAERMARKVSNNENIGGLMTAFIVADIADGAIARKLHAETPLRRFVDAAVDRISVVRVASSVARKNRTARPYILALAVEEAVAIGANLAHYIGTGEVVKGKGIHKLGSLSVALFGVVASGDNESLTHCAGMGTSLINLVLTTDYVMNAIEPYGDVVDGIREIAFDNIRSS